MTSREPHTQQVAAYGPLTVAEPTIRLLLSAFGHDGTGEPDVASLHVAVCERVRAMRDAGDQPEVVLARMKRTAAAALNDADAARGTRPGDASALVAQVGQWCIAEYFRKP